MLRVTRSNPSHQQKRAGSDNPGRFRQALEPPPCFYPEACIAGPCRPGGMWEVRKEQCLPSNQGRDSIQVRYCQMTPEVRKSAAFEYVYATRLETDRVLCGKLEARQC